MCEWAKDQIIDNSFSDTGNDKGEEQWDQNFEGKDKIIWRNTYTSQSSRQRGSLERVQGSEQYFIF